MRSIVSTKIFALSIHIPRRTPRTNIIRALRFACSTPYTKKSIQSIFCKAKKKRELEEFKLVEPNLEEIGCSSSGSLLCRRFDRTASTEREISDAWSRPDKREIMEIHFRRRNRGGLRRYWRRVRRGVRGRAPAWYRFWRTISVATTSREAPGCHCRQCDIAVWLIRNIAGLTVVRMAVGRGSSAVVLRVNTHCKT